MNKNFQKIEKDLRSIAKRYKSVKYSIGLVILFLMMGLNAFSEEVNTGSNVSNSVGTIATREGIRDSVEGLQGKIKDAKAQNTKSIESLRLELIQLMEQGGQVIKSPWASWQFGINYMYNNWSGTYKGSGDKPPKYVYNSIYRRGNWEERNAIDTIAGKSVDGNPITPGNENTNTWQTATTPTGVAKLKRDTSIDASTIGKREWGLVELRKIREPLNEVEIFANVSPKEVKKDKLDIPVSVTPPATLSAPVVKPNVNKPTEAPKVDLPTQPNLEIAQAPAINNDPEIKVLTVNKVGAITIDTPEVKPVDFIIKAGGLSGTPARNFHQDTANKTYNLIGPITVTGDNFISTWGKISGLNTINNDITVTGEKTRAFMIDEGIDYRYGEGTPTNTIKPFIYSGTIRLQNSKTVGLDVQGTHTSYSEGAGQSVNPGFDTIDKVANIKVTNKGTIIGEGGANIENQVAFGFNNFDTSSNNTRTQMINEGTVTLGAENSVAIQLRPEDPYAQTNTSDKKGLNMMTGENIDKGTITLNGAGSFGILTVKNKNLKKYEDSKEKSTDLADSKNYNNYGVTTSAGGQIASRAQEDYKSLVKNTGKINIDSDNSIGVGILNSIQSVEVGGEINIGKGTLGTYGDKNGNSKVDGAVGVYTEEKTRPVAASIFAYKDNGDQEYESDGSLKVKTASKDDHGIVNVSTATETYSTKDADGKTVTKTRLTGKQVGTDTVEVSGTINLGNNSTKSFGLRNSKTGSITLVGTGTVNVEGKENFGALSNATNGEININSAAKIIAKGTQSIGYAMLDGAGINYGSIEVTGDKSTTLSSTNYNGSLGFYGVKGTFTNRGTIKTDGNLAHAVVVKTAGMKFEHYGTIDVNSPAGTVSDPGTPGNIGVFSDGNATVNFYNNSNVFVGKNSIGIYSEDKTKFNNTFKNHGTLNIKIGENSTFAYLDGSATTNLKPFFNDGNKKVTIIEPMGANSSLVYANNGAKALLDTDYTITQGDTKDSTMALLAANTSNVTVDSGKTLTTNTQVALAAVSGSTAENKGTIVSNRSDKGIGIYAKEAGSKGINKDTITMEETNAIGMYGMDVASLESSTGSNIKVKKTGSVGMYGVVSASATVLPFTVTNAGTIELEEGGSAGIYLVNKSTATDKIANLSASNTGTGTIKLKSGEGSIGIYAPKATISNVGTIEIANTATKSIAAYISDGGKITNASTANINLGTSGKNIAYYVKNAGTSIGGANVGTVKGYGVGVYLEGTKANPTATPAVSASQATLEANAPELKFNNGTTDGNGIIGLYLKGNTKISDYTKTITVGNTVGTNSAIAIYSDAQGTSGTGNEYTIKAKIKTGENAVGIFSAPGTDKSYIKYLGSQMNLGEGSTGFYVNGKTELDTTNKTTTINLNGGLVAYVTQNSEFVGGKSEVNLSKSGIGVYGERGAKVDVGSWTFNNNGRAAEEVRLKEGIAKVTTSKTLKPKMVLTHVINGETYLDSGKSVTAIADPLHPAIEKEENIGLMAQGLKNTKVGITWDKGTDYEIINEGTINFKDSIKSTAIYAESARVKNEGTIKLGKSSAGIYGIYRDDSPKFKDNANVEYPNKLEITTTATSSISLGKGSTGMYLVNAEKLNTAGGTIQSDTGATNNGGI